QPDRRRCPLQRPHPPRISLGQVARHADGLRALAREQPRDAPHGARSLGQSSQMEAAAFEYDVCESNIGRRVDWPVAISITRSSPTPKWTIRALPSARKKAPG